MTQHCTITGTMLVPVHYIVCTLKLFFSELTVFVVVKINSFQCQCQCLHGSTLHCSTRYTRYLLRHQRRTQVTIVLNLDK